MNKTNVFASALMVGGLGVMAVLAADPTNTAPAAAAAKPKYNIKEVMQAIHNQPTNSAPDRIINKAKAGKATKAEIDKMVEYYTALPLNKPPMGDEASWKTKTEALLNAAISLQKGETNAVSKISDASNCKACHQVHKKVG